MDKKSILLGSTIELNVIKEELLEQEDLSENIRLITLEKQSLEKEIAAEEKLVEDTISSTIKKRREELEAGFLKEMHYNKGKLKSIKAKRDATKKKAIKNRIKKETREVRLENKRLHKQIKAVFKENHIPRFCDSVLYYALYCTKEFKDFIIFALATILFIALIPNGICYLFKGFWLLRVLLYIGIIIVVIALYILIYRLTKHNKASIFEEMRPNREKISMNNKKIKITKKLIKKDNDDSVYNLSEFDEEVISIEGILTSLEQEKEKALKEFEAITVKAISEEIVNRSKDKIKDLKGEIVNLLSLLKEYENKHKRVTLNITTNYEAYIGSEFMSVNKIDELIKLIEEEKASTIAEAMGIMKGQS